jgi:hypothetical protein
MERTSLITRLMVADIEKYPQVTLVNGIPNDESLAAHFSEASLVQEGADFREKTEDTDHGQVLVQTVRAQMHRDSNFYKLYANRQVMLYIETANGEVHFFGSAANPMNYGFERDSGAGNTDRRHTQLSYSVTVPV